ncbi:MAG: imelysin family protein [Pseudomonadota bacterium]|nr:imelysin family protein [Pseudomonadota bacterium]
MILSLLLACTTDNDKPLDREAQAILDVKALTATDLDALAAAALGVQTAAPAADADGWGATETAGMESAWVDARVAYERVEGAIAVLFPGLDAATDERYDGFIAEGPDENLFDGDHVTGVHAIERIVWADRHPAYVVAFESSLPDYTAAMFPADATQAGDFKDGLCQRLVVDTADMRDQFAPLALDASAAFRGVIGSMAEQYEKVALASTGEDESRYAQHTLGDMRANLAGGYDIYLAFVPWIESIEGGAAIHADIEAGIARVEAGYAAVPGNAIPEVPATWNADAPSAEDLATPYGQLFTLLSTEADPTLAGSLVERMTAAADLLGIPQLPE